MTIYRVTKYVTNNLMFKLKMASYYSNKLKSAMGNRQQGQLD